MRIAVTEDNDYYRELIIKYVKIIFNKRGIYIEILQYNQSKNLVYDIWENKLVDIYLLDIEMPGYSGMEIAGEIRKITKSAIIIFITSHLKYSIEAFELNIYRYIPKEHLEEKLEEALISAYNQIDLLNNECYTIANTQRYEKILYSDIYYIYKDGKNSIFICDNEQIYKVRSSLKDLHTQLNNDCFIFIDRCYIVNIIHIMKISSSIVYLRNGEQLLISKPHIKNVKRNILNYWGATDAKLDDEFN